MTRTHRIARIFVWTALAAAIAGCGGGTRPAHIASRPDDCFVELSDFGVDFLGSSIQMKVHYRFAEKPPHPEAWYAFSFQIQAGATSSVTVRKQGRELPYEGDITANTNASFVGRQGSITVRVRQAQSADGAYADVSETQGVEF